jgi:hypothetical protein
VDAKSSRWIGDIVSRFHWEKEALEGRTWDELPATWKTISDTRDHGTPRLPPTHRADLTATGRDQ